MRNNISIKRLAGFFQYGCTKKSYFFQFLLKSCEIISLVVAGMCSSFDGIFNAGYNALDFGLVVVIIVLLLNCNETNREQITINKTGWSISRTGKNSILQIITILQLINLFICQIYQCYSIRVSQKLSFFVCNIANGNCNF